MIKQIPDTIVIHCSATLNNKRIKPETIDRWHRKRGFRKIGYHVLIQPDGETQTSRGSILRPFAHQGAHVRGGNKKTIGICLIGNTKFTRKQFSALYDVVEILRQIYGIPIWNIRGHYQYKSAQRKGKTCPNLDMNRIIHWFCLGEDEAIEPYLVKES